MFSGSGTNPYEDIVAKTTDENLTSENWELIMNLCDKVIEEGEEGARNVIAALLKRLTHRNANVQLYTLTLSESLSKNCTIELHREIASRAFTQGLERLINDRTTHEKVRRRALGLIATWTAEFENDTSLGIMEELYTSLKAKKMSFDTPQEAPPPAVDDEIRRKEEEELQRVLEMSMQDKGGRAAWASSYTNFASGSGAAQAGSSSAAAQAGGSGSGSGANAAASGSGGMSGYGGASESAPGYVPAQHQHTPAAAAPSSSSTPTPANLPAVGTMPTSVGVVTRVRALFSFEPTESGELGFEKGEIIKVVDRGYKDWWRGQLKGRTGIFPVNYVEALPEPTSEELAREAEKEAAVFAQSANVDKLLTLLREIDAKQEEGAGGGGDSLADNEEIQELYRSCMGLRPQIVKLIDKYSQKRADLVSMNETFVRARTIFDRMMEESLARHTGGYDQSTYRPQFMGAPSYGPQPGPGSPWQQGFPVPTPGPGAYGPSPGPGPEHQQAWGGQPYAPAGHPQGPGGHPHGPAGHPQQGPAGHPQQGPAGHPQPGPAGHPQDGPASYFPQGAGGAGPAPGPHGGQQPQPQQPQAQGYPQHQQPYTEQGPSLYPPADQGSSPYSPAGQPQQHSPSQQYQTPASPTHAQSPGAGSPQPQGGPGQVQPLHIQPHGQPSQAHAQQQPHAQSQSPHGHAQPQSQSGLTDSPNPDAQLALVTGPPYVFTPGGQYPDANASLWAEYYTKGGTDPTGAVYFFDVPGITVRTPGGGPGGVEQGGQPGGAEGQQQQGGYEQGLAGQFGVMSVGPGQGQPGAGAPQA